MGDDAVRALQADPGPVSVAPGHGGDVAGQGVQDGAHHGVSKGLVEIAGPVGAIGQFAGQGGFEGGAGDGGKGHG